MTVSVSSPQGNTLGTAQESVAVRMYRGILGDFFVLTHHNGGATYRALIDCGALQCIGAAGAKPATTESLARLETGIADLLAEGAHFDLVIATHEHYDHLSGFMKYNRHFVDAGFSIGKLWLAWTEDDDDKLATDIRAGRSKGLDALNALVASDANAKSFGLGMGDDKVRSRVEDLRNLLQFNGEPDPESLTRFQERASSMAARAPAAPDEPKPLRLPPRSCRDALGWLKSVAGAGNVSYLQPGQQVRFGLDDRLKASVLGPPRTRARLLKMDPTSGADEAYLVAGDPYAALTDRLTANMTIRRSAVNAGGASAEDMPSDVEVFVPVDSDQPFDQRYDYQPEWKLTWEKGKGDGEIVGEVSADKIDDVVVKSKSSVARLYYHPRNASRRVDGDWLGLAQTLALKIDGDVNNTSLALAFELPDRQVLLFPADAQVGNWLSWHDQEYPSKPGDAAGSGETASDLLSRVVLYKVGHHGSHNATGKAKGLELMTNPNLAAMIPVVEDVAKEQATKSTPGGWAMPYGDLFSRLKTKTSGRILQGDGDKAAELAAFTGGIFDITYADESANPLWVSLKLAVGN